MQRESSENEVIRAGHNPTCLGFLLKGEVEHRHRHIHKEDDVERYRVEIAIFKPRADPSLTALT